MADLGACLVKTPVRVDNEVATPTFLQVAHLARENGIEFRFGHASACESPRTLDWLRSADNDDDVDGGLASYLEQQRYIDHD